MRKVKAFSGYYPGTVSEKINSFIEAEDAILLDVKLVTTPTDNLSAMIVYTDKDSLNTNL